MMDRLVVTLPPDADVRLGQQTTVQADDGEPVPATVVAMQLAEDGRSVEVTVGMDKMPAITSFSRVSAGIEPDC